MNSQRMTRSFTRADLAHSLDAMVDRVDATLSTLDGGFPLVADPETGAWTTTEDGNWCGGHWIGLLWLAAERTGADRFAEAARAYTDRMAAADDLLASMFAGMNYNYAGFRAFDLTGEDRFRTLGLRGADAMVSLYHERARQIPVGEYTIAGPAEQFEFAGTVGDRSPGSQIGAVDMVYTSVPILWRAHRETDEDRYREIATAHVDRHHDWYVREDGSTVQEAEFDPEARKRQEESAGFTEDENDPITAGNDDD